MAGHTNTLVNKQGRRKLFEGGAAIGHNVVNDYWLSRVQRVKKNLQFFFSYQEALIAS